MALGCPDVRARGFVGTFAPLLVCCLRGTQLPFDACLQEDRQVDLAAALVLRGLSKDCDVGLLVGTLVGALMGTLVGALTGTLVGSLRGTLLGTLARPFVLVGLTRAGRRWSDGRALDGIDLTCASAVRAAFG